MGIGKKSGDGDERRYMREIKARGRKIGRTISRRRGT